MTLTTIIVDDEPLARSLLSSILEDMEDVHVVAECQNGFEAIQAITEFLPDMVFLDIEMPEMNGFDVINAIQADILPKIIFTTAYAEYAVEAFRVEALNYVLKPLDDEKIRESIERVKSSMTMDEALPSKHTLLSALQKTADEPSQRTLIVKNNEKLSFLNKTDIDWLEADGDYVCVHSSQATHLIRATLKSIEEQLSEFNFIRIHRSTIVNLDKVQDIIKGQKGEATIVMREGQSLKVSRSYGAALRAKLI